jgi:hypothetical protein
VPPCLLGSPRSNSRTIDGQRSGWGGGPGGRGGGGKPSGLNGWHGGVVRYGSGSLYADEVYEVVQSDAPSTSSIGERVELTPRPEAGHSRSSGHRSRPIIRAPPDTATMAATARTPAGARRDRHGRRSRRLGFYSGTLAWFQHPDNTESSAHYTVYK